MKSYAMTRREIYFSKHETPRHELQNERKAEELKLSRLKKLLETKIQVGSTAIRAA